MNVNEKLEIEIKLIKWGTRMNEWNARVCVFVWGSLPRVMEGRGGKRRLNAIHFLTLDHSIKF